VSPRAEWLHRGVVVALLVVYFVWGSTYLAIRWAIETLPGFTMAGVRFVIAGAALYAWGRARGGAAPRRVHLLPSLGIGALLLLGGNGGVVWAEHRIDSGVAALLVAVEPVWITLLAPLLLRHRHAGWKSLAGLALGLVGVAVLVIDPAGTDASTVDLAGAVAVLVAAFSWALGSLWTVRATLPESRAVATAMQMFFGGALLLVAGAASGEWTGFEAGAVTGRSLVALGYLIVFGSIVAFTAYGYLLRSAPPGIVATYAFVNPVVAVWLGWLLADERIGWRVGLASLVILAAVGLIFRESGSGSRGRRSGSMPEADVALPDQPIESRA